MKDNIATVQELIKKIEIKIKETKGEAQKLWKKFKTQCKRFITKRKKYIANLREEVAAGLDSENLITMLSSYRDSDLAEQLISKNWNIYFAAAKKYRRENPEVSTKFNFVGEYYVTYNLSTKTICKYLRQYAKKFADFGAKFSITSEYNSISIELTEIKESCADLANTMIEDVRAEASKFNFDDSDSMTDYFHKNFYSWGQKAYNLQLV